MSSWFRNYNKGDNPKLRIFCFPYAGGNANIFSSWAKYLPDNIELIAIQSPGRGGRFKEEPIGCLDSKVRELHQEIRSYVELPYIFVGHSNGALLAFELARELQKSGNCNMQHIVISAKRAPHLPKIKEPIYNLPDDEFVNRLQQYEFTPKEVLANQELMEILLPMLRADFSLSDTHNFDASYKLKSDFSLFYGIQDKDVPVEDVFAWQSLIEGKQEQYSFDDGHFFITSQQKLFVNRVLAIVKKLQIVNYA